MKKLVFILLTVGSLYAKADIIDVQKLNKTLSRTDVEWKAADNWVNHQSRENVKHMLGLKNPPTYEVDFIDSANLLKNRSLSGKDLPRKLDWRNKDGKNWVSPILNQANCGSCVAFASIGVLETQYNISSGFAGLNLRLSPQNLFACGGGYCDFGWWPESAADYLMKTGVADEACMPYMSGATGEDVACSAACTDVSQRRLKISNYTTPTRIIKSIDNLREALQKGPLVTTLSVFDDFVAYSSGIYKHSTGGFLGGHAVSIVGYNDDERYFIVRNSWGEDWGEKGFVRVSYDDHSGIGSNTWQFEVPALAGAVSVVSPRDYNYTSGTLDVQLVSTYSSTRNLTVAVFDASNRAIWSKQCSSAQCNEKVSTIAWPDGRYEIQGIALNARGEKVDVSSRQFFYVVNNKPNLVLSFVGHKVDLTKPLSDRVEFDIKAISSSVPMNSLLFHYKNRGGVEKIKEAQIVLNEMRMGWRTNLVPNGEYEVWFSGSLKTPAVESQVESSHIKVNTKN